MDVYEELPDDVEMELANFYANPYSREREHDEEKSRMIEETPLLKRLSFKETDTHWLTLWADWRNPAKYMIIVELVRREDRTVLVDEPYYNSDVAIKRYGEIAKEIEENE